MLTFSLWELILLLFVLTQMPAVVRNLTQVTRFVKNQIDWIEIGIKLGILVWFGVMAMIQLLLIGSWWKSWYWGCAVFFFVTALWIFVLHAVLSKGSSVLTGINNAMPKAVQDTNLLKVGEPYTTKLSILTALMSGIFVICFPNAFFSWWGAFSLILVMFGMAAGLAFPSENKIGPYILFGIMSLVLIIKSFWIMAPTEMERLVIWRTQSQQTTGMNNINDNVNIRKDGQIKTIAAKCWSIPVYDNGDPIVNGDGIITPKPTTIMIGKEEKSAIPPYTFVKVLDKRIISLDAGEQLIQVFVQNEDGTWIIDGSQRSCWIAVSLMSFIPQQGNITDVAKPTIPPDIWKDYEVVKLNVPSKEMVSSPIEVKKGQMVRVKARGLVNSADESNKSDPSYEWVGPEGWGVENSFSANRDGPLTQGESFMALCVRVSESPPSISDGKWTKVGSEKVFTADQDGTLYFIVNDKIRIKSEGPETDWFAQNQGGFELEVQIK